jgi:glucosamine--fructose-6-phosphate aminotransferase (isomerizing)
LSPSGFEIHAPDIAPKVRVTEQLEGSAEELKKDGHPHFMRKELFSQVETLSNVLRGRLSFEQGTAVLGGIRNCEAALRGADKLVLTGCGSAYYAGLMGKRFFEEWTGLSTHVVLANQLPYDSLPMTPKTVVISITQSGITADTVEAQREAKRRGATTLGVVNAVGTTIPNENDGGVYLRVGTESGVASTKAFTAQVAALAMLALSIGRMRGMTLAEGYEAARLIAMLPEGAAKILAASESLKSIATGYSSTTSMYFLGAGAFVPTVLEGALKLKEIAYIHAEAYPSGEMKHGPLALVDKGFPVLVLAPDDMANAQTASVLAKLHGVGARVLLFSDEETSILEEYAAERVVVPRVSISIAPVLWTIMLQRFAYEVAVAKGLNPDRPRHLAKAITVR